LISVFERPEETPGFLPVGHYRACSTQAELRNESGVLIGQECLLVGPISRAGRMIDADFCELSNMLSHYTRY
jgi:hypothetical protein